MKKTELSYQDYSEVYLQLSRMENAGIDPEQVLRILAGNKTEYAQRAQQTKTYLKRGLSFVKAGLSAALFSANDAALLDAAYNSGQQGTVYKHLAQSYGDKARHLRQIKSKALLPLIILLLALFIEPLPRLFSHQLSVFGYLTEIALTVLVLGASVYALFRLGKWVLARDLCRVLPYFGQWCLRRQMHDFIWTLGLMLRAGVPLLEAIPLAAKNLRGTFFRRQSKALLQALQSGQLLSDALATLPGIDKQLLQLVHSGEHSGSLDSMLLHYARLEAENIELHYTSLAQWLPRILYALIALWMASSILGSAFISVDTVLP